MIYYKKNVKDFKMYLHELTWFVCKPFIILCIVAIPPILYYIIVGILAERRLISYAVWCSIFVLVMLLIVLRVRSVYKKVLSEFFESANPDGFVEMSVRLEGGEYVIENLNKKTVSRFDKKNMRSIRFSKNCIFIKTSLGAVLFFPKTDELIAFFKRKPSDNVESNT